MIQIRYGMFETNSSSTHSLCVATDKEYSALLRGEMLINIWSGKPVTKDFVIKKIVKIIKESPNMNDYIISILLSANIELPAHLTEEFFISLSNELVDDIAIELGLEYRSFDSFMGNEYLEVYNKTYTTPGGETIHIFGQYGSDY